jgi:N-glycosylase/DNA lyase
LNHFDLDFPVGELDLPRCLQSGQVFRWQELPDGRWLGVDGETFYLAEPAAAQLRVTSNGHAEDLSRFLRLDLDAAQVALETTGADPVLESIFAEFQGLRVLRPSSAEETFFCFLCTPNNHVARITQMVRRLATYGEPLGTVEGIELHRFPTAAAIAEIPEEELRAHKFGYRAATIIGAARQLLERGPGWLDGLRDRPYPEAHAELLGIKGVGRKLADCIALIGLDHLPAVPVDTHIWQQVVRLYRPEWRGTSLTDAKYLEAGQILRDRFGRHAGWVQQYLFVDNMTHGRSRR